MAKTTTIAGNTFLFTGKLTEFTREDAEAHVEAEGGKILSGVSAKLNYLVVGEDAGSKLAKAEALGTVTILHEKEFLKMMNSGKKSAVKAAPKNANTKESTKPATAKTTANKVSSDKAYEEVQIGKQIWMTKNLNVTSFRNGEQIPLAKSEKEWKKAVLNAKPAMCYYKFDIKSNEKYGILYNWYAVKDEKELAPEGWHIPSDEEWSILIDKCGGEEKGGELIKHTIGWDEFMDDDLESVDGNGNNKSGFSALPVGMCTEEGAFFGHGTQAHFWTSTVFVKSSAIDCRIFEDSKKIECKASEKTNGYSVRLIRD